MSWTSYSTSYIQSDTTKTDTTKLLSAPLWRWNHILTEVQAGRICDSLAKQQTKELAKAIKLQLATDTALAISKEQTFLAEREASVWKGRYEVKDKLAEAKSDDARQYRNQRNWAILLDVVLIVLMIAL